MRLDYRNRYPRPQRRYSPSGGQRGAGPSTRQQGQSWNAPSRDHGNALRNYERYVALAKEAAAKGDTVEAENCCQHAEHYFRVMRERTR
jgi:Domain of unknown function (DUF4167)